jgi:hypothetical protein
VLNPDSSTLNILSGVNPNFAILLSNRSKTYSLLKPFALAIEVASGCRTDS